MLPLLLFVLLLNTVGNLLVANGKEESESNRPRGVSPQLASLYQERAEFECLDGKKKIPFDQVNDDYCDCADGSDEPGTSACKNGRFYCANFGYRPTTLPSSRVNDFICDCCDGSDEWDSGTECPNVCEALGAKAREEAKQRVEVHQAGHAKRKELAKEGAKMLDEKRSELEKRKQELEQLEAVKKGAEERKAAAEAVEKAAKAVQDARWEETRKANQRAKAEELFRKVDADGDGHVTADELKKHAGYQEKEEGTLRSKDLLKELFKEEADQQQTNINFDAFLEQFDKVKEFLRTAKEEEKGKKEEQAEEEKEDKPEDTDGEHVAEPPVDEPHSDEEKTTNADDADDQLQEEKQPPYDQATQELISKADEARKEYDEADSKVSELEGQIRDSEQFLTFEYGPDNAWAPLKGQCAELTTPQYVYKLCLFDRTVQKDRNGHHEIGLGYWGKWTGPDGEDNNNNASKFNAQLYEHGQTCWNGPERSTMVRFDCGEELQLVDVSEPSKCEYHFSAKSPAVCVDPEELFKAEHVEL